MRGRRRRESYGVAAVAVICLATFAFAAPAGSANTWSVATLLTGVACTSATTCLAVGGTLVEQWNGTTWTITADAHNGVLSAITCAGTTCFAVGSTANGYTRILHRG
jgi:hypothetical protein